MIFECFQRFVKKKTNSDPVLSLNYLNNRESEKFGTTALGVGHGNEKEEHIERPDEVEQLGLRHRMLTQIVWIERAERFELESILTSFIATKKA